ncbi:YdcF family protein, partial [Zunongwangia atlantica 22II14-10F7]
MMKKQLLTLVFFVAYLSTHAQGINNPKVYKTLAKKNFYFLYAIENNPEIKELLIQDNKLSEVLENQKNEISEVLKSNTNNLDSLIDPYLINQNESAQILESLYRHYKNSKKFRDFIKADIRDSGAYILYEDLEDQEFLKKIWALNA